MMLDNFSFITQLQRQHQQQQIVLYNKKICRRNILIVAYMRYKAIFVQITRRGISIVIASLRRVG